MDVEHVPTKLSREQHDALVASLPADFFDKLLTPCVVCGKMLNQAARKEHTPGCFDSAHRAARSERAQRIPRA